MCIVLYKNGGLSEVLALLGLHHLYVKKVRLGIVLLPHGNMAHFDRRRFWHQDSQACFIRQVQSIVCHEFRWLLKLVCVLSPKAVFRGSI